MEMRGRLPLVEGAMPRFANGADMTDFGSYVELNFWVLHIVPGHGSERVMVGEPITMTAPDFVKMLQTMGNVPLLVH